MLKYLCKITLSIFKAHMNLYVKMIKLFLALFLLRKSIKKGVSVFS